MNDMDTSDDAESDSKPDTKPSQRSANGFDNKSQTSQQNDTEMVNLQQVVEPTNFVYCGVCIIPDLWWVSGVEQCMW